MGAWGLLNTILLYTQILDFGFVDALTRKTAKDGPAAAIPFIVWLSARFTAIGIPAAAIILISSIYLPDRQDLLYGVAAAGTAGLFQVLAGWFISLRLGTHEQFWFNVRTIVSTLMRALVVIFFYHPGSEYPYTLFGVALLSGSIAEIVMTVPLSVKFKKDWRKRKQFSANAKGVLELSRGFALSNLLQRAQQPTWFALVFGFGGSTALGVFTVATRLPIVINSSINQAQRVLLPGLSELRKGSDTSGINRLLRDGVLVQVLIVVPAFMIFLALRERFFIVWLGTAPATLVSATAILTISLMIQSISTPFFWALQSFGDGNKIAATTAITLTTLIIFGGALLYYSGGDVVTFSWAYLLTRFQGLCLILWWSEKRWGIVRSSMVQISAVRTLSFVIGIAGLAWYSQSVAVGETVLAQLLVSLLIFAIPYTVCVFLVYRKALLSREP